MDTRGSWKVRMFKELINVVNMPNLPKSPLDWTCEQRNRMDDLVDFAYDNYMNEISWNDKRIKDRHCI